MKTQTRRSQADICTNGLRPPIRPLTADDVAAYAQRCQLAADRLDRATQRLAELRRNGGDATQRIPNERRFPGFGQDWS